MKHASKPPIERNSVDNIVMEERFFPGYLRSTLEGAAKNPQTAELVHAATVHAANRYTDYAQYTACLEGLALAIEAYRRTEP